MSWSVSRAYREALKAEHPVLFTGKGTPLRMLIAYARTTNNLRDDAPIVSEEKLREIDGTGVNVRSFAQEFVNYAHSILPNMRFSGYGSEKGPRVLNYVGFRMETKAERDDDDKVDWVTGKRVSMLELAKEREYPRSIFEAQKRLMDYLNTPCSHAWAKAKKRFWDRPALNAVVERLDDTKPRPDVYESRSQQDAAWVDLNPLYVEWQPIYGPSKVGNTHRLFSQNNYWSFMRSELTDYLLQDYVTLDLKACHLAVAARDWNIEPLLAIMQDTTKNVWDELKSDTGISEKDLVKELTYVVVYGGGDAEIAKTISKFILDGKRAKMTADDKKRAQAMRKGFDSSSIIKALKVGAQVAQIRIKEKGGIEDAFGHWHELGDRKVTTLLALRSQSLEMALLLPALEVVEDRDHEARIVLWMHDGFTIYGRIPKQLDRDVKKIQSLVDAEARRRGIPTRLEVK